MTRENWIGRAKLPSPGSKTRKRSAGLHVHTKQIPNAPTAQYVIQRREFSERSVIVVRNVEELTADLAMNEEVQANSCCI